MKNLISLILVTLIFGCGGKDDISTNIDNVNLSYSLKIDSYKDLKYPISGINKILSYRDKIILVDYKQKSIYTCDHNFSVLKRIDLMNKYDFMFKSRIADVHLKDDILYFSDDTFVIKKYYLKTDQVKSVELKVKYFQGFPFNIAIDYNRNIIASFGCLYNSGQDKIKGEYFWGAIYDSLGNSIKALTLSKEDFGHEQINSDYAYYFGTEYNKYVCFKFSKYVIKLDSMFNKVKKYTLITDKGWLKPYINKDKGVYGKNINYQPICRYKNYFLSLILPDESTKDTKMIVYDASFNPVKIIVLNGIKERYWYNTTISEDNMFLYNQYGSFDQNIYLYDLSKIGL